jgi:hypothetical protein
MKFNQNTSSGKRVSPCGQKHGHEEADRRFSLFRKGTYMPAITFTTPNLIQV